MITRRLPIVLIATVLISNALAIAQTERPAPVCSPDTRAAFTPLPELAYACPDGLNDSDEALLKLPQRLAAIRNVITELAAFTNFAWWRAGVDDLNACAFQDVVGELTGDQIEAWKRGDYRFQLFGNHEIRLALIDDPCYQTGFNGSNAFLLFRKNGKVFVTQVLDGYYSRADNSVEIDFASLNGRQVIEVSTANSIPPSLTHAYFEIDPKSNRAIPKNIFKEGRKFTNQISSAMLLGAPGNPPPELKIIARHRLSPTFSAYEESERDDDRGGIDDNGRRLRRIVYRWNGRFYSASLAA